MVGSLGRPGKVMKAVIFQTLFMSGREWGKFFCLLCLGQVGSSSFVNPNLWVG